MENPFDGKQSFEDEPKGCKICGDDYVHISKITIGLAKGAEETGFHTLITSDGGKPEVSEGHFPSKHRDRTIAFAVDYDCEHCHSYREITSFHKGITYITIKSLPYPKDDSDFARTQTDRSDAQ